MIDLINVISMVKHTSVITNLLINYKLIKYVERLWKITIKFIFGIADSRNLIKIANLQNKSVFNDVLKKIFSKFSKKFLQNLRNIILNDSVWTSSFKNISSNLKYSVSTLCFAHD